MSFRSHEVVYGVHRAGFESQRAASRVSSTPRAMLEKPSSAKHEPRLASDLYIAPQAKRRLSHSECVRADRFESTEATTPFSQSPTLSVTTFP